jgi:hypothetical protein
MESKVGSILSLIGGILSLISAVVILLIGIFSIIGGAAAQSATPAIGFGAFFLVLGIVQALIGVFAIKASQWMKLPETTHKGGITALICGIVGGLNVLLIMAGIFGLIDSGKPSQGRVK